jgi:hypothetical protein
MFKMTFHTFTMGDVEDIDVYVAQPIWDWQQTEQGRWVMKHAHNLTYITQPDDLHWGHRIVIRGEINDPVKVTEYFLRWPDQAQS